jgi:hypothetical protein
MESISCFIELALCFNGLFTCGLLETGVLRETNHTGDLILTSCAMKKELVNNTAEIKDKLPFLGGIPVGDFFKQKQANEKQPLLILVKPTIVREKLEED